MSLSALTIMPPPSERQTSMWDVWGKKVPRSEIEYFTVVIIVFIVIVTSIYNLSKGDGTNSNLWTSLLSSCLGYLLPNPTLKASHKGTYRPTGTDC